MKPLIVLVAVFTIAALVSVIATSNWNLVFSGNLAMFLMLCLTAFGHFRFTRGMSLMLPPFVPAKATLVYLTGLLEAILGIALLFPALRMYAGYTLIAFFILILPANIYASARHINIEKGTYDGPGLPYLWFRIPLQIFFIAWTYCFSVR